jgi:hypothetical protein
MGLTSTLPKFWLTIFTVVFVNHFTLFGRQTRTANMIPLVTAIALQPINLLRRDICRVFTRWTDDALLVKLEGGICVVLSLDNCARLSRLAHRVLQGYGGRASPNIHADSLNRIILL